MTTLTDARALAERLRDLAAYKHDDLSIGNDAAAAIDALADVAEACDVARNSKVVPREASRAIAWLVELRSYGVFVGWLSASENFNLGWTIDANKAIRFARKEDADGFRHRFGFNFANTGTTHLSTEHLWFEDAAPAPAAPADYPSVSDTVRYPTPTGAPAADDLVARLRTFVEAQAADPGLWFVAQYASEAYLQQALRELHALIEGEGEI